MVRHTPKKKNNRRHWCTQKNIDKDLRNFPSHILHFYGVSNSTAAFSILNLADT